MICIRCRRDSKHKDRKNQVCPHCNGRFAFERGDPITDLLFQNALEAVSGAGRIRWGRDHLYYEICRRIRRRRDPLGAYKVWLGPVAVIAAWATVKFGAANLIVALLVAAALIWFGRMRARFVPLTKPQFQRLFERWCQAHGTPHGVLPPVQFNPAMTVKHRSVPTQIEPDIADYSFDRAVICDRADTVDLLIANNFHFENNCAVLSIDGYPPEPFDTVKTMLKRNPRLLTVTLHDATPVGCRIAGIIAHDPQWFGGKLKIIDLGLRPNHAGPLRGLYQRRTDAAIQAGGDITAAEARWFDRYRLELAAFRPEDILKRLHRGLQAHADDDVSSGGTSNCGSFETSDSSDGAPGDDGASDSFG